jgi:hypothetical protein
VHAGDDINGTRHTRRDGVCFHHAIHSLLICFIDIDLAHYSSVHLMLPEQSLEVEQAAPIR